MKSAALRIVLLGFVVLAVSVIPAYADGITYDFSSSSMTGLSGASVSGSFDYNSATHTITGATLTLSGSIFGNITVDLGSLTGGKNKTAFIFKSIFFNPETKKMDLLKLLVFLDPKTHNLLSVSGLVHDPTGKWGTFYTSKFTAVPEEMGWGAYLLDSCVLLGAMLIARRQTRPVRLMPATA